MCTAQGRRHSNTGARLFPLTATISTTGGRRYNPLRRPLLGQLLYGGMTQPKFGFEGWASRAGLNRGVSYYARLGDMRGKAQRSLTIIRATVGVMWTWGPFGVADFSKLPLGFVPEAHSLRNPKPYSLYTTRIPVYM